MTERVTPKTLPREAGPFGRPEVAAPAGPTDLMESPPNPGYAASAADAPLRALSAIRYRFFLFAGILPYLLGAAWAYAQEGAFLPGPFWLGLLGILFAVCGVEAFNEYFDSRLGTDRVFNPEDEDPIPAWVLTLGLAAFACAFACGILLAWRGGWPIILYALLGGLAALFYVGPPIRWVYRGLGEAMIALSYGPWMTLGSVHLHTGRFSWGALAASLAPGLLVMSLAVVNAIPDYYQDRLVGKRNLVVRLGRKKAVYLYAGLAGAGLFTLVLGAALGTFPRASALAALASAPLAYAGFKAARETYDEPRRFVGAVRWIVLCYVLATSLFIISLLAGRAGPPLLVGSVAGPAPRPRPAAAFPWG